MHLKFISGRKLIWWVHMHKSHYSHHKWSLCLLFTFNVNQCAPSNPTNTHTGIHTKSTLLSKNSSSPRWPLEQGCLRLSSHLLHPFFFPLDIMIIIWIDLPHLSRPFNLPNPNRICAIDSQSNQGYASGAHWKEEWRGERKKKRTVGSKVFVGPTKIGERTLDSQLSLSSFKFPQFQWHPEVFITTSDTLFLTFPPHHHLWEMGHLKSLLFFIFMCMSLNLHLSTPFSSSAYRLNSTTTKHHHHRWRQPISCRIITVDRHGLGDFLSVQAAIESVAKNNREHVIIKINAGNYM